MDFKKRAEELSSAGESGCNTCGSRTTDIEQALKQVREDTLEEIAQLAGEASWLTAKEIRELKGKAL